MIKRLMHDMHTLDILQNLSFSCLIEMIKSGEMGWADGGGGAAEGCRWEGRTLSLVDNKKQNRIIINSLL
jgi:hypothetical protein